MNNTEVYGCDVDKVYRVGIGQVLRKSGVTKLSIPPPTSGDPLRPSKSCILKRFSTPYIKPFRRHWSVEEYSILSHLRLGARDREDLREEEERGGAAADD